MRLLPGSLLGKQFCWKPPPFFFPPQLLVSVVCSTEMSKNSQRRAVVWLPLKKWQLSLPIPRPWVTYFLSNGRNGFIPEDIPRRG